MTKSTQELVQSVFKQTIKYLLPTVVLLTAVSYKDISYGLGLLFGGLGGLVNFYLLAFSTDNLFNHKVRSRFYYPMFYLLRITIAGLIIYRAITLHSLNLFTTVIGLFAVKIALTLDAVLKHYKAVNVDSQNS